MCDAKQRHTKHRPMCYVMFVMCFAFEALKLRWRAKNNKNGLKFFSFFFSSPARRCTHSLRAEEVLNRGPLQHLGPLCCTYLKRSADRAAIWQMWRPWIYFYCLMQVGKIIILHKLARKAERGDQKNAPTPTQRKVSEVHSCVLFSFGPCLRWMFGTNGE